MAAASQLVLSDLLCFLVNKFGKMSSRTLKTMLTDFYHVDVLSEAKVRLLGDVKSLNLSSNLPHIPQRRVSDAKLQLEADDILSILTFVDEAKALDNLPRYVSSSPENMPSCRLYEGDLDVILRIMKDINRRVGEVESLLVTFGQQVTQVKEAVRPTQSVSVPGWPSLHESARVGQQAVSVSTGNFELPTTAVIESDRDRSSTCPPRDGVPSARSEAGSSWATLASTPCAQANRFSVLSSATDDEGQQSSFTTVVSRRSRNKRRHSRQTNSGGVATTQQSEHSGIQSATSQSGQQRRRIPLMHGRSSNRSVISAAEITRKKLVYCVDNVNTSCTVEDIKEFISRLAVNTVSCFQVKTRRRYNEDASVLNRKAFRVCIYEDERDRFLNLDAWPHSIRISKWFSKPRSGQTGGDDKRIRVDNGENTTVEVRAIQQLSSVQPAAGQSSTLLSCDGDSRELHPAGDNDNDDTIIMASEDKSMEYTDANDAIDAAE